MIRTNAFGFRSDARVSRPTLLALAALVKLLVGCGLAGFGLAGCGSTARDKHREGKYGANYDENPTSGHGGSGSNDAYFPVLDLDVR